MLGTLTGTEYRSIYGTSATFDGESVGTSGVVVKYTYYGDTDLNGTINFDDYVRTDNGFNNHLTGWMNGDFDYSNTAVNFDDYVLIDLAFNTQSGTRGGGGGNHLVELGQMWHFRLDGYMDYFITAMEKYGHHYTYLDFYPDGRIPPPIDVPEPTSIGLLGLAGAGLMARRRRA